MNNAPHYTRGPRTRPGPHATNNLRTTWKLWYASLTGTTLTLGCAVFGTLTDPGNAWSPGIAVLAVVCAVSAEIVRRRLVEWNEVEETAHRVREFLRQQSP